MDDLEALLPVITKYHVTNLYRTDSCEYVVYSRGAFVTDPASPDCEIDIDGPHPRLAIDAQARTDLDAIYREIRAPRREAPSGLSAIPAGRRRGSRGLVWLPLVH